MIRLSRSMRCFHTKASKLDTPAGCRAAFDSVFDATLSCEQNLRAAMRLLLDDPPTVEALVRLRAIHERAAPYDRYSTALVWLAVFNALRSIYQDRISVAGVPYLNRLRVADVNLLAPTWSCPRERFGAL